MATPAVTKSDDDRTTFLIRLPVHTRYNALLEQDTDQDKPASGLDLANPTDLDADLDTDLVESAVLRLLALLTKEAKGITALLNALAITHKPSFRKSYLAPALTEGLIEMTLPDKPTSRNQKYRLTAKGRALLQRIKNPH